MKKKVWMNSSDYQRTLNGNRYFGQSAQDLFVTSVLEGKRNGTYLEIGGAHPFDSNNTYLLETEFNWKGFSIEYNPLLCQLHQSFRSNECICEDATAIDYADLFISRQLPHQIDYLSLDIDPAENSFKALQALPLSEYRFSVITYEHDKYLSGNTFMEKSRHLLSELGYHLACSNVHCFGRDYEDWWVDPLIVNTSNDRFTFNSAEFDQIIKALHSSSPR